MITTEALPRIPVNRFNTDGSDYVVPDGYRLVIETVSMFAIIGENWAECESADNLPKFVIAFTPLANAARIVLPSIWLSGHLVHTVNTTQVSLRVVAGPGITVLPQISCPAGPINAFDWSFFGYLVSVNSPSLAP